MSGTDWIEAPESQTVRRFRYNATSQILAVEFTSGATYEYFDVPTDVFDQMNAAGSKGQFLAQRIKGVYRYGRM